MGYTGAIGLVGAQTISDVAFLDVLPRIAHRAGRVLEQNLLLRRRHQTVQVAGLLPVVVIGVMVLVGCFALHRQRWLGELGLVAP